MSAPSALRTFEFCPDAVVRSLEDEEELPHDVQTHTSDVCTGIYLSYSLSPMSVSYTHLDVYKRQDVDIVLPILKRTAADWSVCLIERCD